MNRICLEYRMHPSSMKKGGLTAKVREYVARYVLVLPSLRSVAPKRLAAPSGRGTAARRLAPYGLFYKSINSLVCQERELRGTNCAPAR